MSQFKEAKSKKVRELLEAEGVTSIKFNELKSVLGTIVMACEFFDGEGNILARGVSIRSLKDTFNKNRGKNKAFGRCVKAISNKIDSYPVRDDVGIEEDLVKRTIRWKTDEEKTECENILKHYAVDSKPLPENKGGSGYLVTLSSLVPVMVASNHVKFKSAYKPQNRITD